MAGISLDIKLDDTRVRELIERIRRRTNDFRPALADMGERMTKHSIPLNFRAGGRPEKWKPSARARKEIKGRTGQTLDDTGRLKGSITYRESAHDLKIGTNVVYARIHQLGGQVEGTFDVRRHVRTIRQAFGRAIAPKKVKVKAHRRTVDFTLPARPFLVVQDEDVDYFREALGAFLAEVGG